MDVLSALIPPGVMAAVVVAFVVWLFKSQLAKKDEEDGVEQGATNDGRSDLE